MQSRFAVAFALLAAVGCASAPPAPSTPVVAPAPDPSLDRILGHMGERLAIAHDVARFKWANRRPVDDPAREQALLADMDTKAKARGLDERLVRRFFLGQIDAGKDLQRSDLRAWFATPPPADAPPVDLAVLRQRLDGLGETLLEDLATLSGAPLDAGLCTAAIERARTVLTGDGVDDAVRSKAVSALCREH